jgi:HEAT repeat protein
MAYGGPEDDGMESPRSLAPLQKEPLTPEETAAREKNKNLRVQEYIRMLKSPYLHFRWHAAEALGEEGDPAAVGPLIEALKDPYVDVAWLAAKSLGMIGDSRSFEPLLALLKSEEKWLRTGAAWGLGKLRDKRAVDPLILLLSDPKHGVRKTAAWALGKIGDDRAIPVLSGIPMLVSAPRHRKRLTLLQRQKPSLLQRHSNMCA